MIYFYHFRDQLFVIDGESHRVGSFDEYRGQIYLWKTVPKDLLPEAYSDYDAALRQGKATEQDLFCQMSDMLYCEAKRMLSEMEYEKFWTR